METTKEREQNQARLSSAEREGVRQSQATNENIRQLLEMLDNPDVYTEQEIQDIINRDEDTRETYRLMIEAKRSSRHRQHQKPVDVDAAWQKFREKVITFHSSLQKIAASFIGMLLVSGIAFAAIHVVRQHQKMEVPKAEVTESATSPASTATADTLASDIVAVQPVIYDNIALEKMLPEIAAHYDAEVTFANEEVRGFRFHFVWNPGQDIANVVNDLNRFEHLHVTLKDNQLIVE